ncbi:NAD(P)-binding protein [Lojkania enalia]|uniref:NAD(P)-binding protein n=1 Tax=Lojkania enalia TaxID=147567 RepID=A0A9P4JZ66_9PLEO|nr:NAD(P)-binding protein [Didymosphaeria enalia]
MADSTKTVLITGASSGLGLAFLRHYASQSSTQIIALDITPLPPSASSRPNIDFHKIDITSPSLSCLPFLLSTSQPPTINLLIHSAGIRGLVPSIVSAKHGDVTAAETLQVMDHETMLRTFEINTWGTFNVVRTFLPCLKSASTQSRPAKVIIMSSRMGSISSNGMGGAYAYRASKAGLNAIVKSLSVDVPEVAFCLLHPGRVETGLVRWKEEGAISVEESLQDCLKVIDGVEKREMMFVDRFGEEIGW